MPADERPHFDQPTRDFQRWLAEIDDEFADRDGRPKDLGG